MFPSTILKARPLLSTSSRALAFRRFHTLPIVRAENDIISTETRLQEFVGLHEKLEDQLTLMKEGKPAPDFHVARKELHDNLKALGKPTFETAPHIATGVYTQALCNLVEGGSIYNTLASLQTAFQVAEGTVGWGPLITTKISFELVRIYKYLNQIDALIVQGEKSLIGAEIHPDQFSAVEITDIAESVVRSHYSRKRFVEGYNVANRIHHMIQRRYLSGEDESSLLGCFVKMEVLIASYFYYQKEFINLFPILDAIEKEYFQKGVMTTWPWGESDSFLFQGIVNFLRGGAHLSLKNAEKAEKPLQDALGFFQYANSDFANQWISTCMKSFQKLESLKKKQGGDDDDDE
ncbi:hypothetical protein AKO1_012533 [Acrasis kona]|uniref:Uncharacterized protein n=1 Tax=Acrasis kona TaxID=1008807 RepID=A0AAW2YY50_9EUKA